MSLKPERIRACDICRKKKVRCDGPGQFGGPCGICTLISAECTYNIPPIKRGTPKGYVQTLEARLAKLEELIRKYSSPDTHGSPSSSTPHDRSTSGDSTPEAQPKLTPLPMRAYPTPPDVDPLSPLEEVMSSDDEFVEELCSSRVFVEKSYENIRFYGKSSEIALANQLANEKRKGAGVDYIQNRRQEFWDVPDWMASALKPPMRFEFPTTDLMQHLVNCYFDNLNILLPLLHRPSFVRSITEGLHTIDQSFGATVLLVCAIGCRYSEDPRVSHELTTSTSCTAWKLFNQALRLQRVDYLPHSLYEAQTYPLVALFLEGFSPPETTWVLIGVGLRVLQNGSVHRKFFSEKRSLENELWKRAFWVLIVLDRSFSTVLGRSCLIQDEDFDTDLPLLCNDEDLEESSSKSPARHPTQMCSFVAVIKLTQVLAFTLRTLYSTKRSRVILGYTGKRWEQNIIAALDSALNRWVDTVPEHLRQGSEFSQRDRTYQIQSAFLWCQFYGVQLHVHRVFALRDPPDLELTTPSMIICKSAAKQCIGIVESMKDVLIIPLCAHVLMQPIFDACTFLLLVFWKKNAIDYSSPEYSAIGAVTEMVQLTSKRWKTSSSLQNILRILRGMIDGPYSGWRPTIKDWEETKFGSVLYVNKEGFLSHKETNTKSRGYAKYCQDASSHSPGSGRRTYPPGGSMERANSGDLQPMDFSTNHPGINEVAGGTNEAHIMGDSSVLPMDFMVYNDLMMGIEGTSGFLGQEFQDSVLCGPTPMPLASQALRSLDVPAWQRLIGHPLCTDDRISLVKMIFSDHSGTEAVKGLRGDDAQAFVDVVDEVLDVLAPSLRKKCLTTLCKICGSQGLLPRSVQIPPCHDPMDNPLARGGYAEVYKGNYHGREVAVKVLKVYQTSDFNKITRRFCKEVMTWKSLRHPNVLPLVGVAMGNNKFAMVSEWMANGSIDEYVKAHANVNRFELLEDVARGLMFMHGEGMIHGDLKGANILIDRHGHACLADFGLITFTSDPGNSITTNSVANAGTTRWMSPELLDPEHFGFKDGRPTKGSDCYALGMVIYEVLSGQVPFARDKNWIVVPKVIQGERPERPEGAWFTDDLWKTLQQCWSPSPQDRPTVEAVLDCLHKQT